MNGIRAYQDTAVTTQSKGRLIVMLYEGAVKFLKLAIQEAEAENYEAKGNYINKAMDIITELNAVVDMTSGGEIAEVPQERSCFEMATSAQPESEH